MTFAIHSIFCTFAHIPPSFAFWLCGNFTFVVVFALREYSTSTFHHWQYSVIKSLATLHIPIHRIHNHPHLFLLCANRPSLLASQCWSFFILLLSLLSRSLSLSFPHPPCYSLFGFGCLPLSIRQLSSQKCYVALLHFFLAKNFLLYNWGFYSLHLVFSTRFFLDFI